MTQKYFFKKCTYKEKLLLWRKDSLKLQSPKELWKTLKPFVWNAKVGNKAKASLKKDGIIQFNPFMTEADIIWKLLCKSMEWFLYDIGLRHERVKPGKNANIFKKFYSELLSQTSEKLTDCTSRYQLLYWYI